MALSGFPELLPAQRFVELAVLDRLRHTFELHGFAPLETPAVESLDQLTRKGEIEKEVYVLRGLHADADSSDSGLGLHFDLTVPFAALRAGTRRPPRVSRSAATRSEGLARRAPARGTLSRVHPGRHRRGGPRCAAVPPRRRDRPGDGRGARVAGVLPRLRLQVNNRKLIEGFYLGLGATDIPAVMRIVDKLDKVDRGVATQLLQN